MGHRLVFRALPTLAVAATIATQASAATVNLSLSATLGGPNSDSAFFEGEADRVSDVASALFLFPGRSASSVEAEGSADTRTGQLRFGLNGRYDCEVTSCGAQFAASALTRVTETLLVTGTGTLTAVMQVEASWAAPRYNFTSSLFLRSGGFANDQVSFASDPSLNMAGSALDQLLSAEIDFNNAANTAVTANWRLQGDIGAFNPDDGQSALGIMNANNTATFFLFASEGLSFEAASESFLSDAAYLDLDSPSPIPLPAGLPLLLAGLGAFAIMRCRCIKANRA